MSGFGSNLAGGNAGVRLSAETSAFRRGMQDAQAAVETFSVKAQVAYREAAVAATQLATAQGLVRAEIGRLQENKGSYDVLATSMMGAAKAQKELNSSIEEAEHSA